MDRLNYDISNDLRVFWTADPEEILIREASDEIRVASKDLPSLLLAIEAIMDAQALNEARFYPPEADVDISK